jgi:hypothetical protein
LKYWRGWKAKSARYLKYKWWFIEQLFFQMFSCLLNKCIQRICLCIIILCVALQICSNLIWEGQFWTFCFKSASTSILYC